MRSAKFYVGLFRAISSNCEIKNLTIENAVVKASRDGARVGILVGDVYGSLTVEIVTSVEQSKLQMERIRLNRQVV